jgi:large subunit GTPase 1
MPRSQGTSRKGKPKKFELAAGMGRSLQKSKKKTHTPSPSAGGMAMRKNVDSINIEKEDNRASVLDMNDLDDFLTQAEMANREFASEKEQFVILDPTAQAAEAEESQKTITWSDQPASNSSFAFQELSVPRRPAWDATTTPEELDHREKEDFLEWRRAIAEKEEEIILNSRSPLGVTPFEKNIEIWRQLWRVMERCSVIVQIVDARNPLFYLSKDLRQYATKELGKPMLLLVNKSDYLTPLQRKAWHDHFSDPDNKWEHVFFSAHEQQQRLDEEAALAAVEEDEQEQEVDLLGDDEDDSDQEEPTKEQVETTVAPEASAKLDNIGVETPLSREGLLSWLLEYAKKNDCQSDPKYDRLPFGMVGFPNVGKSSVINVLMGHAKHAHGVVRVAVAAQPGKTKHFQTLLLPDREDMLLVDCPGLVFPSFVNNTADLIAAGVFPIAQMRDPWPVVNLLCRRIPREILNALYGIHIPMPSADAMLLVKDGTIPNPTAEEFLTTYCVARSMLAASSGIPDFHRASRIVIKEYASGKLLYCHSPPTFDDKAFQRETIEHVVRSSKKLQDRLTKPTDASRRSSEYPSDSENEDSDDDGEPEINEVDMLLEMMDGAAVSSSQQSNSDTRSHTRKKKWGKKGRKLRNKDPYGCQLTPDDMLGGEAAPMGVSVKSGKKHDRKGYTRPVGYGATRKDSATTGATTSVA